MVVRAGFVALLLALAIASLASRAEASDASSERPTCRVVKVVYAGHGEAERAPCRPVR